MKHNIELEYLKKEFERYKKARKKKKSYEAFRPDKASAFLSLCKQIEKYLKPRSKILEVGFGSGYLLTLLAKLGHEVYGIDTSNLSSRYAKALFEEKDVSGKLSIGSGFKINYPSKTFDLVLSIGVIEHFPLNEQTAFVKEMARVSKNLVLISVPNEKPKSLFQKFKKTKYYVPEIENIPDFGKLCKQNNLQPIKLSGFCTWAATEMADRDLLLFYKKYKLRHMPRDKFYKKYINSDVKAELRLSDRVLYNRGFLKYVLASTNGIDSLKLATVACLHGNIGNARKFAARFRKENVDAVALVGDIGADEKQRQSLIKIIKIFSKLNKKIFVMPGNHEQLPAYDSTMKKFRKNKFIVDCVRNPCVYFGRQKFVFWPGSGTAHVQGAGFFLIENKRYAKRLRKKIRAHGQHFFNPVKFLLFNNFTKLLDKNTVVITHSPSRFKTKNAIDLAVFGEPAKPFVLLKAHQKISKTTIRKVFLPGNAIFALDEAKALIKYGYPVKILQKNVGNEYYRKILKRYKITKFICGDIHEAGGRANDWKGRKIKQNKFNKELFFNCAAGKDGRAGVVEFLNGKAKYKVVRV